MRYRYWISAGAGIIVGLTFIFSGLGKLLNQADFLGILLANSFLTTTTLVHVVAYTLSWIELGLGALLITGISIKLTASLSAVPIAGFIAHNIWMINQGLAYEPCSCFGTFEKIILGNPSTVDSLVIDIVLLALVLIILFCYPGKFFEARPWFFRRK